MGSAYERRQYYVMPSLIGDAIPRMIPDKEIQFNSTTVAVVLYIRADSRFAPSQWETSLQSNAVSHWLGADPESALYMIYWIWTV